VRSFYKVKLTFYDSRLQVITYAVLPVPSGVTVASFLRWVVAGYDNFDLRVFGSDVGVDFRAGQDVEAVILEKRLDFSPSALI